MRKIIGGKEYNTKTALMVVTDEKIDRYDRYTNGRPTYLYRTAKGNFFAVHWDCGRRERDGIKVLTENEAKKLFEELDGDAEGYEKAFGEKPEEA